MSEADTSAGLCFIDTNIWIYAFVEAFIDELLERPVKAPGFKILGRAASQDGDA